MNRTRPSSSPISQAKILNVVFTCRYHAFDNTRKDTEDNTQVPELMEKVEELITDNQGLLFRSNKG